MKIATLILGMILAVAAVPAFASMIPCTKPHEVHHGEFVTQTLGCKGLDPRLVAAKAGDLPLFDRVDAYEGDDAWKVYFFHQGCLVDTRYMDSLDSVEGLQ